MMIRRFPFFRYALAVALLLTWGVGPSAFAQAPSNDEAASRALFDEGRRLMDQGQFAQACPKFEEGQRLAPGVGMKFNLAECYERLGKLASAWAAFLDVASTARAAGQQDRETVARRRAKALESDLLRVKIDVPPTSRLEGLEIRRDGTLVGAGQWGSAIPADSGPHTILASAPGRKQLKLQSVVAGNPGSVTTVTIPLLEIDPLSREKPTAIATTSSRGGTQRAFGWIVAGVGAAGVAAGSVFGIVAMNKYGQSSQYCFPQNQCLPEGITLRQSAISNGNISTVAFVAGGVALVGGVVLLLAAPSGEAPRVGWLLRGGSVEF